MAKRPSAAVAILIGTAAVVAFVVLVVVPDISRHAEVSVHNDTHTWVRFAGCVDGSADINPGDSVTAEGVASHGVLYCLVTPEARLPSKNALPYQTRKVMRL